MSLLMRARPIGCVRRAKKLRCCRRNANSVISDFVGRLRVRLVMLRLLIAVVEDGASVLPLASYL
jgi:hypothetical protein